MRRISKRTVFLLILMGILVAGLLFFTARYFLHAREWVTFQGSPHVYSGSNLSSGKVTDRSGVLRSEERRVGKECRSRWSPYH